jgi:hypothetical protein
MTDAQYPWTQNLAYEPPYITPTYTRRKRRRIAILIAAISISAAAIVHHVWGR